LEPEFPASINNALGQLSPAQNYPHRSAKPEVPAGQARPAPRRALRRSQSLPPQSEDMLLEGDSEMPERNAVSEGDADDEEISQHVADPRFRAWMQRQFEKELAVFTSLLEGRRRRPSPAAMSDRRTAGQPCRPIENESHPGSTNQRQEGYVAASPTYEPLHSSDESGIILGAIPDRGMECGFGPPVLPGTYSSRTESEEPSPHSDRARADQATQVSQPLNRHGRLQILHDLFHEGSDIPVGPEVLRFALDLVSSDTSLNAEGDEAVQLLAERLAEVRGLAGPEEEDEEEEEMDPDEGYERSRPRTTGRGGQRRRAQQAAPEATWTRAWAQPSPEPISEPCTRPERAYSM